jgi:thiol-disulfide isomerase/thioredoxin
MIHRHFLCVLCVSAVSLSSGFAQKPDQAEAEEQQLEEALAEAGSSAVDFIRALEVHLAKHPDSKRRPELERALAKAALETKDDKRIVLYGERVLARDPDDLELLDRVARALLATGQNDKALSERALNYARRFEVGLRQAEKSKPSGRVSPAHWREEIDRGLGRALALQARATGNLGRTAEAAVLAQTSYDTYPTAEAARETARWLARSGKHQEAIRRYADAFTISDPRSTDADRASARASMGELYRKLKGSESGLGDLVLEAYDRTTALLGERRLKLRQADPNVQVTNPAEFTLTGLDGDKLALASLRGKVLVMDFWATWCGPCRVQHPLYQEVKRNFKDRSDVVFLSVNTDEERDGVREFLEAHQWEKRVYFEDGLSSALRVSSIPTTVLLDKKGEVISRMNGFIPERFVEMLTERIREALSQ